MECGKRAWRALTKLISKSAFHQIGLRLLRAVTFLSLHRPVLRSLLWLRLTIFLGAQEFYNFYNICKFQIPELPSVNVSFAPGDKLSLKVTFVEGLDRVWVNMDGVR